MVFVGLEYFIGFFCISFLSFSWFGYMLCKLFVLDMDDIVVNIDMVDEEVMFGVFFDDIGDSVKLRE